MIDGRVFWRAAIDSAILVRQSKALGFETVVKVKIAYLTTSGQLGGAERSLLDLLAVLCMIRPEWSLRLIAAEEGPLIARAAALGVAATVMRFPRSVARFGDFAKPESNRFEFARRGVSAAAAVLPYAVRLFQALDKATPDLIHTNGFKMHILGIWARRRGVPVVWHVRDHVGSRPIMARLLRSHARQCAAAVTNSNRVAADVKSVCRGELDVYPIHDGIDLDDFSPAGRVLDLDALAAMPLPDRATVRVGLLATMARWKGHSVFLHALSRLPKHLRVRGYLISGPVYQTTGSECRLSDMRALAAELGIGDKVGFANFVDEPAAAMRALDIVVHASTEPEPFGRVIGEAMACGRPVIASQSAGAVELLNPGVDALTHPPGDFCMLARRIATLADDAELRERMARRSRVAAERHFDRIRPAKQMIPVYQALTPAAN